MHTFYRKFIQPLSKDSDQAEREIVLNYLLVGIFALSVISWINTLLAPVISDEPPHPVRLAGITINILLVVGLYALARYKHHHKMVGILLTLLIAAAGCAVALKWGMLNTNSILLLSLSVVMAGILIGARYSLYVTCGLVIVFLYIQHGEWTGRLQPDLHWLNTKPTTGDVIGFSTILFVIALVSWLFNRQMELSLQRARRSEKALQQQRDLLEVKVKERTQELEAAQLRQMQEFYRFAELGRLSTALFHDLANHLATVSVDIEGLKNRDKSAIMQRMHDNVRHIDNVVQRVRQQIQGKSSVESFNVIPEIKEVIKMLAFNAERADVTVRLEPGNVKSSLFYKADLTRFRQLLLNLICNGIEAYGGKRRAGPERVVIIRLERMKTNLIIHVVDYGGGIPANDLPQIFEPFYSTKPKGVGIGLFIVKQIVEKDFQGTLTVVSDKQQGTTFSISLPKTYYAKTERS